MQKEFNFIPLDYDYFDYQGNNYVKIIGRTDKNKKICVIDSCDVYFWAILKNSLLDKQIRKLQNRIETVKANNSGRVSEVLKTELHKKKFLGKDVKAIKIFITNYKDAKDIADKLRHKEIDKIRGYDLGFITHYIIEKKFLPLKWYRIEGELLNNSVEFGGLDSSMDIDCIKVEKITPADIDSFTPKILSYDIETDEFEIGRGEIVMISLVGEDFKKVLTWKNKSKHSYVETFKDEEAMLEAFVKYVKEYDPDILSGYFSDGFDLPYLRARAEKNRISLNLGVDNSKPTFSKGRLLTGRIKGIVHIDLLRFIQTNYSQYMQSETLSLNEVSSELLGETKKEWEHKHSSKINAEEWEDYFEYNLQDSILTYKLTEKAWPDLREFTKIIQEPLFEISRESMSSHVESYILHNLPEFDEIPERHPHHDEIGSRRMEEKYEGAFVLQPVPGLYEDLVFFDFTSMYATVIATYNLSKSSFSKKKIPDSTEVILDRKKVYFSKKQEFFPKMLEEIIKKRKQYKKEFIERKDNLSKARSNAFKLLANASYGYQGFFGARYYCIEAAAATAALARVSIKKAIEQIKKEGYEVIYSDTDSIAVLCKGKSQAEMRELLKKIDSKLPGIMELDLEGFFKRGIWVTKRTGEFGAKKKYALIDGNNKLKIRGFETVRRDWCDLARTTQNRVLELILNEGNEKSALEYLKKIVKQIKERKVDFKQLVIKTQLKKPIEEYKSESPHVTIAKKMRESNLPVNIGMIIEYYISEQEGSKKTKSGKSKSLVRERAKIPGEPGNYDIEYYLNNQILPAVENIFEVFGINVVEILSSRKQTSLGDF